MKLAEQIKKKNKTFYQQVAENNDVSVDFVGKIAHGQRVPTRGKGLEVKRRKTTCSVETTPLQKTLP